MSIVMRIAPTRVLRGGPNDISTPAPPTAAGSSARRWRAPAYAGLACGRRRPRCGLVPGAPAASCPSRTLRSDCRRSAGEGEAEAGGDGVILRTEPAVDVLSALVAAAPGQMVDAAMAGQQGADCVFALDLATLRHERVSREELAAGISWAIWTKHGRCVLVPMAEVARSHKAAFPHAEAVLFGVVLVSLEAAMGVRLGVERPAISHEPAMEVDGIHHAVANVTAGIFPVGAEILAADGAVGNQLVEGFDRELAAGVDASGLVEADLVLLGRINSVEAIQRAIHCKSIGVVCSRRGEDEEE